MTDKQIIIDYENLCENKSKEVGCYNTFDGSCIKEQCFTYRLLQLLKTKEQEYEELKSDLTDLSKIIDCKNGTILTFKEQLDQLKGENVGALKQLEFVRTLNTVQEAEIRKLKQTLAEIKPILEFYANSNMGEEQPDKTYHIMVNGSYIMVYDPKPARQALQKINEVENEKKENCN